MLFEEDGAWSALDYDIAAQAKTLTDLQEAIVRALEVHVAVSVQMGREPFQDVKAAPRRLWDLYETGKSVESRPVPFRLAQGPALPPIRPELRIAVSPAS